MKDKGNCNPVTYVSWMMCKFLGALLLALGINMLFTYTGSVNYMMGVANNMPFTGMVGTAAEIVSQVVAWSWPVVATLVGLSLLTCFRKCWATTVLVAYLFLFVLSKLWTGDIPGATWDLLVVIYVMMMTAYCGMGMMCEKKK